MRTVTDKFAETYTDNHGVIRWVSNDSVPPTEILTDFVVAGLTDTDTVVHSLNVKKQEDLEFLKQYVANRQKYGYSDEEKFEMRAAFAGETVVDIFTGEVVNY